MPPLPGSAGLLAAGGSHRGALGAERVLRGLHDAAGLELVVGGPGVVARAAGGVGKARHKQPDGGH
jgi:hypothetical protein